MFDLFVNKHFCVSKKNKNGRFCVMNERQREIVDYLNNHKQATVGELAGKLFVSEMTVRRDLAYLEKGGHLKRYHGGAVAPEQVMMQPLQIRTHHNNKEKSELAAMAAEYIEDGMTLYLDSSSTCGYLIPHIAKKDGITVVTNSARHLLLLSERNIPTIFIGGNYYNKDMCCIGERTVSEIKRMNYDIGFFSSTGYIEGGKITDREPHQTAIRVAALENSQRGIFMFDRTKLGVIYPYTVCEAKDAYCIITLK